MNIFKRILKKYWEDQFKILYYTAESRYYPQCNGRYLYLDVSGIINLCNGDIPVTGFNTEREALNFINKFKGQRFLERVKIIDVK